MSVHGSAQMLSNRRCFSTRFSLCFTLKKPSRDLIGLYYSSENLSEIDVYINWMSLKLDAAKKNGLRKNTDMHYKYP